MNQPGLQENGKLRLLLLAPDKALSGGIAAWTQRLKKHLDYDRIDLRIIDTSKLYASLGSRMGIIGALYGCRNMLLNAFRLLRALSTFKPDIVYFTCAPSIGYVVRDILYMHLLRFLRVPYVVHFRGGKTSYFFGHYPIVKAYICSALRRARAVIVLTRDVERMAKELLDGDAVIYIPNMIEDSVAERIPQKDVRDERPLRLIHVAWLAIPKGTMDVIEALPMVRSPVKCDMIGELAEENRRIFEQRIEENGIREIVSFAGVLKGRELEEKYLNADIFVLPTHSEGFPNAVLEAMVYGVPIIATDVGNIREMVDADGRAPAGVLLEHVNPVVPEELARCIDMLCGDVELRRKLSINGRNRSRQEYVASKVVPQLEKLLFGVRDRSKR